MATKSKDPVVASLSGALAGIVETSVVWPMELTKTKLQLDKEKRFKGSMLTAARATVAADGPVGLYRGMLPVLVGSIPKAGIRFGGYSFVSDLIRPADGNMTPLRNLGAGMVAGALEAVVAVAPIETVKTKLIDGNKSFSQGFVEILKKEGPGGFYKGVFATVGKQSSNQGLRFMFFDVYTNAVTGKKRKLNPIESLVGGMCAGCFSTMCNNPFDMVKSRMQGLRGGEYKNFADCLVKVVRDEGIFTLWSGIIPRLARVVPGQGVIFMSYGTISAKVAEATGRQR